MYVINYYADYITIGERPCQENWDRCAGVSFMLGLRNCKIVIIGPFPSPDWEVPPLPTRGHFLGGLGNGPCEQEK